MKINFLKSFVLILFLSTSFSALAQDVMIATLQHGETMSAFYGPDALGAALESAQQGDVISLSPGTFNAATITKGVTIQGAGYKWDPENNRYWTLIKNDLYINLQPGQSGLTLEGLLIENPIRYENEVNQLAIRKSKVYGFYYQESASINNFIIDQCRIYDISLSDVQNCYIKNSAIYNLNSTVSTSTLMADHCDILVSSGVGTFKNCIFNCIYTTESIVEKCVYYSGDSKFEMGNRRLSYEEWQTFFKKGEDDWSSYNFDTATFELSNPSEFLGNDGTQVGIYGGETPFTDVPTNPQITKKEIAKQATAEGKLSVKITVEAQK